MIAIARDAAAPYLRRDVQEALCGALRPGGFATTDRALALRPLPSGARVLDVGCGLGTSVRMLRERYGLHAFGIDASIELLSESSNRLQLFCADAASIPLQSESLDAVFFECALSLCPDHRTALAEASRTLRPGGVLVISDIYRRAGNSPDTASGCLSGAVTQEALFDTLARAGLALLAWEDHSRLLADCAARLTFAGVPAHVFFGACGAESYCGAVARNFGYSLCLAEKRKTVSDPYVEKT